MGYVYLLHFDRPYKHANHYMGFSEEHPEKPGGRIEQHRKGTGANLTRIIKEQGIGFQVARIWEDVDRNFERKKKNQGRGRRHCPICRSQKKS